MLTLVSFSVQDLIRVGIIPIRSCKGNETCVYSKYGYKSFTAKV